MFVHCWDDFVVVEKAFLKFDSPHTKEKQLKLKTNKWVLFSDFPLSERCNLECCDNMFMHTFFVVVGIPNNVLCE